MKKLIFALSLVIACHQFVIADEVSATDLIADIYKSCVSQYSTSCIKSKALAWISHAVNQDKIKITDEMSIVRTGEDEFDAQARSGNAVVNLFDRLDSFLSSHSLRIEAPKILKQEEARSMVPSSLLKGGLAEGLQVPLVEGNAVQGRSFVKKVMIPFLLGLKFKTTVLVPIALALIALKTWKAMTLGLLSLVMTIAMVIFKFAKPKIVNYEVVHYPHVHHPIDHHHVHHPPPAHLHAHPVVLEPTPGWARSVDAQKSAYSAHL